MLCVINGFFFGYSAGDTGPGCDSLALTTKTSHAQRKVRGYHGNTETVARKWQCSPEKHEVLSQCCYNAGPTLKLHWINTLCLWAGNSGGGYLILRKHDNFTQWWFNVRPASWTVDQHLPSDGWTSRVGWVSPSIKTRDLFLYYQLGRSYISPHLQCYTSRQILFCRLN